MHISILFENRLIHKTYEAWTERDAHQSPGASAAGAARLATIEWRSRIARGKRRAYQSSRGKLAVTHAIWIGEREFRGVAIQRWQLEPVTGRSHQLRFELARRHRFLNADKRRSRPYDTPLNDPLARAAQQAVAGRRRHGHHRPGAGEPPFGVTKSRMEKTRDRPQLWAGVARRGEMSYVA